MSKSDELEHAQSELGSFQYIWQNECEGILAKYFPIGDVQGMSQAMTLIQDQLYEILGEKVKETQDKEVKYGTENRII